MRNHMTVRGIECDSNSQLAEALYVRKVVLHGRREKNGFVALHCSSDKLGHELKDDQ